MPVHWKLAFPAGQIEHLSVSGARYVPASQYRQEVAPLLLIVASGQSMHAFVSIPPIEEYLPAKHFVHVDDPGSVLNLPGAHEIHVDDDDAP